MLLFWLDPPASYPTWVVVLSGFVILVTALAVIWFVFGVKEQNRIQYRIIIILLFFALSCVSSLLFASNAEIRGNIGALTLVIAGPAAVWFGGFLLFDRIFPEDKAFPLAAPHDWTTIDGFAKLLRDREHQLGWEMYSEWRNRVSDTYMKLFTRGNEEYICKNLLEAACFAHGKNRIERVSVATAFFYFYNGALEKDPGYIVKIQRIVGIKRDLNPAYIRFTSNPSFQQRIPEAVFLDGRNNKDRLTIADAFTDLNREGVRKEGFHAVLHERVDCCIVSGYSDYPTNREDYALVDLSRFSSTNLGQVVFGVLMPNVTKDFTIHTMRGSLFVPKDDTPLSFLTQHPEVSGDTQLLNEKLGPWLVAIDEGLANAGDHKLEIEARSTLERIRDEIGQRISTLPGWDESQPFSFTALFKAFQPIHTRSFHIDKAHDVTLVLLRW
jgi:hypothetical protein